MSEIKNKKDGSIIATSGFKVEDLVVKKFNDWKQDQDSQKWLLVMGYDLTKIEKILALKITGSFKSDVQIQVKIFLKDLVEAQNISVKLVSNERGFNFYGQNKVEITKKGNLKLGKVVIQRKGGDGGKETANMLQFKFDPYLLFDLKASEKEI